MSTKQSKWSNKHIEKENVNIKTTCQKFTTVFPLLRNKRQKTKLKN